MNMNYIRFILFIALCGNMITLRAQGTQDDETDPYKEIYTLKKNLAKKDNQIDKLNADLAEVRQELVMVDSLLKVEKIAGKSKELKDKLKELQQENASLKAELENYGVNAEIVVNQQLENNKAQLIALHQQHSKDSLEVENLKKELAALSTFRKMWIAQLAESVDDKWLNKPYSQIDASELERTVAQYKEYVSTDKRIENAYGKLNTLLAECLVYEQGVETVNSLYDATYVNKTASSVKNIRDKVTDPDKKKELALLYWQLDNYSVTVEIFQDIISAVDAQITFGLTHKQAWPLVNAVLEKTEKDDEYITAIKKIPWLAKQYKEYYKALEKNCVISNAVRETIMSIKP